jgi:aspartyl-tRNA(Asn)/glutamyl-tRNA(Gln) amidotransferase subunit C
MKIDTTTVDQVAHLARLEFDGAEKERIINDMSRMLTFVEKLNELDTSATEPLIYMTEETGHLRDDVVKQEVTQKEALQNAPKKDSDYFKVPKMVDKK